MNPISSTPPTTPVTAPARTSATSAAQKPAETSRPSASDRLELSGASHLLDLAKQSDVRADKVAQIKAQIEAGTYDLDAKADVVADRLLDDLEG